MRLLMRAALSSVHLCQVDLLEPSGDKDSWAPGVKWLINASHLPMPSYPKLYSGSWWGCLGGGEKGKPCFRECSDVWENKCTTPVDQPVNQCRHLNVS